jgi:small multidrug resistance family-3 protein
VASSRRSKLIPTLRRGYAAYGGVLIILSLAWGRLIDGFEPDRWDLLGAAVCLVGVSIIYFAPRSG